MDYWIQDNFIFTKKSVVAIFEIEPIDVVLLPTSEQEAFFADLHRTLNSIGDTHIQLITRTRNAEPKDLDKHFRNLTSQEFSFKSKKLQETTSELMQGYIRELNGILENNIIPVKEYYVMFKEDVNTSSEHKTLEAIKRLDRFIQRFTENLRRAGIKTKQVRNYDLLSSSGNSKVEEYSHKALEKLIISFVRL